MPRETKAKEGGGTTATRTKAEKPEQLCACGCGQKTKGNFAMGHDSKLRGKIHRILEGKEPVSSIPQVAVERFPPIRVMRFTGTELEEVEVPDGHFNRQKGVDAMKHYEEVKRREAEAAKAKAEAKQPEPAQTQ